MDQREIGIDGTSVDSHPSLDMVAFVVSNEGRALSCVFGVGSEDDVHGIAIFGGALRIGERYPLSIIVFGRISESFVGAGQRLFVVIYYDCVFFAGSFSAIHGVAEIEEFVEFIFFDASHAIGEAFHLFGESFGLFLGVAGSELRFVRS